jgi:hypothetical protein
MSLLGVTTNQERPDLQVVRISDLLGVVSDLDEVVHLGPADTELTQQVGEGIAPGRLEQRRQLGVQCAAEHHRDAGKSTYGSRTTSALGIPATFLRPVMFSISAARTPVRARHARSGNELWCSQA